jgi:hypothetical protein
MVQDLDDILKEIWPGVRKRHLFPELPTPKFVQGKEHVALDIKGKRISVSKEFVQGMSQLVEPRKVLEGILDHAVSHHLYCPWDFSTHLKLYKEAKKVLKDKEMAQSAADYFMDVVADTHCVSQKDTPLPEVYRHLKRGGLDKAIHALYQRIWGMDLGVQGHEKVSRKLSRLPYLDRSRWTETIRRFSKVIQPLLEMKEQLEGPEAPNHMGGHKLDQYSSQEVDKGLKDLALDVDTPAKFKEIVHDFEEEIMEAMQPSEQGMGL